MQEKRNKNVMQYLIVCPLVFLAGLVDSIAGGGGLISLPGNLRSQHRACHGKHSRNSGNSNLSFQISVL